MNTRRVKDIAAAILEQIKSLPEDQNLKDDPKTLDILVRVESMMAFKRLNEILLELNKSDAMADQMSLIPLLTFLGERWDRIKETNAVYPLAPKSRANLACYVLAKELSSVTNTPVYDWLMPTVGVKNYKTSKGDLSSLKLHEFVFADDGHTPIEVRVALDELKKFVSEAKGASIHNYRLLHTCRQDDAKKELSTVEKERVTSHSVEANNYVIAIILGENVNEMQQKFYEALEKNSYNVTAKYTGTGEKMLAAKLLKNVSSQQQLFDTLKDIPKRDWSECLGAMSTDKLTKLMLSDETLVKSVQNRSNYKKNDEDYNKAIIFCFAMVYKKQRSEGQKYTSSVGWLADYTKGWAGGYTKEQKELAVDALLEFLMSGKSLGQLKEYFKTSNGGKNACHIGPLFQGYSDLGSIGNQAILISSPEFFQEPTPVLPVTKARYW